MLTRLVALAVVGGLGAGLVLRIWLGRGRFKLLVTLATLPVVAHAALTLAAGVRAGVAPVGAGAFLAGALVVAAVGVVLGRRSVAVRPWLAVFTPLLSAAVYAAVPLLLFYFALRDAGARLDVLAAAGLVTLALFATCVLVSFAPPSLASRQPRVPPPRGRA